MRSALSASLALTVVRPHSGELGLEEDGERSIIFDDQDVCRFWSAARFHREFETRSLSRARGPNRDPPAMGVDDPLVDGEPQSETRSQPRVGSIELAKQPGQRFGLDADSLVGDRYLDHPARGPGRDRDRATCGREPARVGQEVGQDLQDRLWVDRDEWQRVGQINRDRPFDIFARRALRPGESASATSARVRSNSRASGLEVLRAPVRS